MLFYNLLLLVLTLAGGSIPLWIKSIDEDKTDYLLAFSGSFLLSITLLHLLPETFNDLGHKAGIFLLAGFFLQLLLQRFTHGAEHGHSHVVLEGAHHHTTSHTHSHTLPLGSLIAGLSLHAFMEGLPLGFNYRFDATEPALYLAVAAHKLPEALLLTSLVMHQKGRRHAGWVLLCFSIITPAASFLAVYLGERYHMMSNVILWLVPIVAGAFIQIATTIFFESGTRQHMLSVKKTSAILLGVGLGLVTLLFE